MARATALALGCDRVLTVVVHGRTVAPPVECRDIGGDALLCRLTKWILECRAGDRPGILRPARVAAPPVRRRGFSWRDAGRVACVAISHGPPARDG
jgi:hypothetical protein